jgi:hypothetical protein
LTTKEMWYTDWVSRYESGLVVSACSIIEQDLQLIFFQLLFGCCHRTWFFPVSGLADGFVQVFYQIVGIFNTNADANQAIGESVFNPFFSGNGCMGHGSRVIDK